MKLRLAAILLIAISVIGVGWFYVVNFKTPQSSSLGKQKNLVISQINVDQVDILNSSLQPDQKYIVVKGTTVDSCSQLSEPEIIMATQSSDIQIEIYAYKPTDAECNQEETLFEEEVVLDLSGYPTGEYTLDIVGYKKVFNHE